MECRHSIIHNVLYCQAAKQFGHNGSGYCLLCRDQFPATEIFTPLPGQSGPASPPAMERSPSSPLPTNSDENGKGHAGGSAAPAPPANCSVCNRAFRYGEMGLHTQTGFVHYACEARKYMGANERK